MIEYFINSEGRIIAANVESGKVYITIEIGGRKIINPSIELFLSQGWMPYIPPAPEPILPTIEQLVESKLRERYTINQEFEMHRKRDTEPQAFQAYYDYVEECIAWANEQPHRDEQKLIRK